MRSLLLCNALLVSWADTALATDFTGNVIGILDGDTIEVLHHQHPERIRLKGIDCPDKSQAYGKRAKQAASALAFGKEVMVQTHGHDKYKRTIGAPARWHKRESHTR